MIPRPAYLSALRRALERAPVVALLGPRQSGKTTLARQLVGETAATWLDLEAPADQARLANPQLYLEGLSGRVVIDEIQLQPELFGLLRVLVDRPTRPARFLILGSASPDILRRTSETLAGRVEFVELGPLDVSEAGADEVERLWLRGGFPRSFLAGADADSLAWRENFITTFLQRDLPQLGLRLPAVALRRFWTMLAHWHGGLWNAAELGRAFGASDRAVRGYLDLLCGTYLMRQVQPWHANLAKRQVKSPKIYLRDSGLLHALLGLPDRDALYAHPKVGASWEGFCLEQVLRVVRPPEAWFWATHNGAEIDLVYPVRDRLHGVEVKWREQPRVTRSMRTALADLRLERIWLLYPGRERIPLDDRITALPLGQIAELPRQG